MRIARTLDPVNFFLLVPGLVCLATHADFARIEAPAFAILMLAVWVGRNRLAWNARAPRWCAPVQSWSRNVWFCCAAPALLSIALRLMLLPWMPVPHPRVPDAFSHLFLAKTFLLGRFA